MELNKNERIDDLQFKGLKIIQNKNGFCFGIDAVLLSDFAKDMKENAEVVDLCTGNGIIPILLAGKTAARKIYGVEIQEDVAEMATRSIKLNSLEEKIEIINRDLNNIKDIIRAGSIDYVTVNPPYKKKGSGIINEKETKTISRHEISCTLEDIIKESARILKSGGNLYMIHKAERLVDILYFMRKEKVEPKRIKFIHPSTEKAPNLVLIEGTRSGNSFLKVDAPLYVYDKQGNYTKDIRNIYSMD